MKKIAKIAALVIALYLIASVIFSVCCAFSSNPWKMRQNRNGLLCMEVTATDFVVYSPFCNYSDVFLFGATIEEGNLRIFSDGFDCFGEW